MATDDLVLAPISTLRMGGKLKYGAIYYRPEPYEARGWAYADTPERATEKALWRWTHEGDADGWD